MAKSCSLAASHLAVRLHGVTTLLARSPSATPWRRFSLSPSSRPENRSTKQVGGEEKEWIAEVKSIRVAPPFFPRVIAPPPDLQPSVADFFFVAVSLKRREFDTRGRKVYREKGEENRNHPPLCFFFSVLFPFSPWRRRVVVPKESRPFSHF